MRLINKKTLCILTIVAAISFLTACGAKSTREDYGYYDVKETMAAASYDTEEAYEEISEAEVSMKAAGLGYTNSDDGITDVSGSNMINENGNTLERKLIRNINVTLETEKFDTVKDTIRKNIEELGGYIENSYEYLGDYYSSSNRNASITARIPADKTDQFINTSFKDAYISSMNENTEDITLRYSDLKTKLETLETERDRLIELLKKAEDVEAIIALEERLTEIRYELESIQSSLKNYDNHVTYSTIWINIDEVKRVEPSVKATFGERISDGFARSTEDLMTGLEDFAVWFLSNILSILLFAAIVTGIVLLIKKILKRKKVEKKNTENEKISNENKQ